MARIKCIGTHKMLISMVLKMEVERPARRFTDAVERTSCEITGFSYPSGSSTTTTRLDAKPPVYR